MLLSLVVQCFFLSYLFKIKEVNNKKKMYLFSAWLTILIILLFWRVFNLPYFDKKTLIFLSVTQYRLNSLLTVLGATLVYNGAQLYLWFRELRLFEKQIMKKGKKNLILVSLMIPVSLGLILLFSSHWVVQTFANVSFEQIIYMLSEPLQGTDTKQIYNYIYSPVLNTLFIDSIMLLFFNFWLTYK